MMTTMTVPPRVARVDTTTIVHLTSSTFYGGPERQMLEMALHLPADYRTVFLSFAEGGNCHDFLNRAKNHGLRAQPLEHDTPHLMSATRELTHLLRELSAAIVCCHGYKANLIGRMACGRAGVPAVAVSRGWTAENGKVRLYEALDRKVLRWMDRVVCVSAGQAEKVRRAGVSPARITIIRNSVQSLRFTHPKPAYREQLQAMFRHPPLRMIGAAGRLSPEKGFDVLVDAAALAMKQDPSLGFVLFGEGTQRAALMEKIAAKGLQERFILGGFRRDLDSLLPHFDLLVLPSYTEGLPNVVLEAFSAGVPVVATAVGGTPEVIDHGVSGFLVPPGNAAELSRQILAAVQSESTRAAMGAHGRERVLREFTFEGQSQSYQHLFRELLPLHVRQRLPCPGDGC